VAVLMVLLGIYLLRRAIRLTIRGSRAAARQGDRPSVPAGHDLESV
jgi:hypothetical protein